MVIFGNRFKLTTNSFTFTLMVTPNHELQKKIHLVISAFVVISVSFVYGGNPSVFLPYVFGFEVASIDLKNILRAIMGLYIAFGCYWLYGLLKTAYWRGAVISNILFMGGLAFGRIVSTLIDGISPQFIVGLILELTFMLWGFYLLKIDSLSKEK